MVGAFLFMNPYAIHAADLAAAQAEMGRDCPTFNWNNKDCQILPGSVQQNAPLRSGGFSQIFDLSFISVVAQFQTNCKPDAITLKNQLMNSPMVYLGESYRIKSVEVMPGAAFYRIGSVSLNQNA